LAEVALAARHEQARSIGDVLLRRTRLGLLAARELTVAAPAAGSSPVELVGDILAHELGWDAERLRLELARFADEALAEGIVAEVDRPEAPAEEDTAAVTPDAEW
ncbi:MAG TPA: glycerol-3-phosphate dehydrogenase C-terminal domain-containing protein, partial [Solirubrobacteraceae bacterium]|nr:glycerol-3-phosphate dehydrogenase C-terminal domain-containing protein [Solirubrobacteraceae bacterium]